MYSTMEMRQRMMLKQTLLEASSMPPLPPNSNSNRVLCRHLPLVLQPPLAERLEPHHHLSFESTKIARRRRRQCE